MPPDISTGEIQTEKETAGTTWTQMASCARAFTCRGFREVARLAGEVEDLKSLSV